MSLTLDMYNPAEIKLCNNNPALACRWLSGREYYMRYTSVYQLRP